MEEHRSLLFPDRSVPSGPRTRFAGRPTRRSPERWLGLRRPSRLRNDVGTGSGSATIAQTQAPAPGKLLRPRSASRTATTRAPARLHHQPRLGGRGPVSGSPTTSASGPAHLRSRPQSHAPRRPRPPGWLRPASDSVATSVSGSPTTSASGLRPDLNVGLVNVYGLRQSVRLTAFAPTVQLPARPAGTSGSSCLGFPARPPRSAGQVVGGSGFARRPRHRSRTSPPSRRRLRPLSFHPHREQRATRRDLRRSTPRPWTRCPARPWSRGRRRPRQGFRLVPRPERSRASPGLIGFCRALGAQNQVAQTGGPSRNATGLENGTGSSRSRRGDSGSGATSTISGCRGRAGPPVTPGRNGLAGSASKQWLQIPGVLHAQIGVGLRYVDIGGRSTTAAAVDPAKAGDSSAAGSASPLGSSTDGTSTVGVRGPRPRGTRCRDRSAPSASRSSAPSASRSIASEGS